MRVHARVAQTLRAAGIDTMFGLMGDANLFVAISYIEEHGGRFVPALDEGGAVSMADGFARTSGQIGVASVTHGPGVTNTLTALTEAVRARSHLVLLTGDTPSMTDHLQRFDIRAAAALAGADYVRIAGPSTAAEQLWQALSTVAATSTPVVVDVPLDQTL
jgi:acetolactate synthase I/II/III large subunit